MLLRRRRELTRRRDLPVRVADTGSRLKSVLRLHGNQVAGRHFYDAALNGQPDAVSRVLVARDVKAQPGAQHGVVSRERRAMPAAAIASAVKNECVDAVSSGSCGSV